MNGPAETLEKATDWWIAVAEDYLDFLKRNPFFLQWMGITLRQHLFAKRWMDMALERTFRQIDIPSQGMIRLQERVTLLEHKWGDCREEELARMARVFVERLVETLPDQTHGGKKRGPVLIQRKT
jgi:hypothetical protein